MVAKLRRFWFEFEGDWPAIPAPLNIGCGVTAWTYDDAINLLGMGAFPGQKLPPVRRCIEDVDVTSLRVNQDILAGYMRSPNWRGIWFPRELDIPGIR